MHLPAGRSYLFAKRSIFPLEEHIFPLEEHIFLLEEHIFLLEEHIFLGKEYIFRQKDGISSGWKGIFQLTKPIHPSPSSISIREEFLRCRGEAPDMRQICPLSSPGPSTSLRRAALLGQGAPILNMVPLS